MTAAWRTCEVAKALGPAEFAPRLRSLHGQWPLLRNHRRIGYLRFFTFLL